MMFYHRLFRDGTCAVNNGKHIPFQKGMGHLCFSIGSQFFCSLLSTLPHTVPMVPKALIGYCKVWDRRPVWLSIPVVIG